MAYRVVHFFYDLQDGGHTYYPGDTYPRDGVGVSEKRVAELASAKNRLKTPLIEEVKRRTKKEG